MFRRIKNLWILSGKNFTADGGTLDKNKVQSLWDKIEEDFAPKRRMAQIVDMADPIEEFPQKEA